MAGQLEGEEEQLVLAATLKEIALGQALAAEQLVLGMWWKTSR